MKRPVLFIDRDGTLIKEPADEQIDSFEKLDFYPKVFQYLSKIASELNFEIVMITNQDGLGTDIYPENTFWPVHNFVVKTFEQEGIVFKEQFIDRTFAKDNAPTRKPNTGLLTKYFSEDYDLENSLVIGDRLTDVELAKNLGAKGVFINDNTNLGTDEVTVSNSELQDYIALETNDWEAIYKFLKTTERIGS
ncbi:MAG: histidinol-phosphatase, partial [Winogradskyella sp.]